MSTNGDKSNDVIIANILSDWAKNKTKIHFETDDMCLDDVTILEVPGNNPIFLVGRPYDKIPNFGPEDVLSIDYYGNYGWYMCMFNQ